MSKFPLYDSLSKDLPKEDLTMVQKQSFIKKIQKMDHKKLKYYEFYMSDMLTFSFYLNLKKQILFFDFFTVPAKSKFD